MTADPSCLIEVIDAGALTCNIQTFIKTKCRNQDNSAGGSPNKSGSLEIGADTGPPRSHLIPKTDYLRDHNIRCLPHFHL